MEGNIERSRCSGIEQAVGHNHQGGYHKEVSNA